MERLNLVRAAQSTFVSVYTMVKTLDYHSYADVAHMQRTCVYTVHTKWSLGYLISQIYARVKPPLLLTT